MQGLENASQPNDDIWHHMKSKTNTNGAEMLKFLENGGIKRLNNREERRDLRWTGPRIQKRTGSMFTIQC